MVLTRQKKLLSFLTIAFYLVITNFPAQAEMVNKIIAKINHKIITQADLNQYRSQRKKDGADDLSTHVLLDELIDELIIQREIEKAEIAVEETQITQVIEGELAGRNITIEQFQKQLQKEGTTLTQYREKIKKQIQRDRFLQEQVYAGIKILDYDSEEYFNQHPNEFLGYEKVRFQEILLTRETLPEDQNPMQFSFSLVEKLRRGYSFSQLAKKYSRGAFASQGGDSKLIPTESIRKDIMNALYNLKKGEISQPIRTKVGILILKLIDHRGKVPRDFNDIKHLAQKKVFEIKAEEALEQYLIRVRAKHFVEILI